MKSIKKAGFSSQYFLTEQGLIYDAKTNEYRKTYKDHCFKLKDQCGMTKTISLKNLYYRVYGKVFCIDNIQSIDNEEWRPVKGSNEYFISNFARVKSYKRYESILLKPFLNKKENAYYNVKLTIDGITRNYSLHRLVAAAFVQMPLQNIKNYQVHHKDFDRTNNAADNLIWITKEDHRKLHEQHYKQIEKKKVMQ